MKNLLLLILFMLPALVAAQVGGKVDASQKSVADSLLQPVVHRGQSVDSSQVAIQHRLDSIHGRLSQVQLQLDSLQKLGLGGSKQQDSLQQLLVKGHSLQQEWIQKYNYISGPLVKVPGLEEYLPTEILPQDVLPQLSIPQGRVPEQSLPEIQVSEMPYVSLTKVGADLQLPGLSQSSLPTIDSSTFSGKNIDTELEAQLLKQKEVAALQEQAGIGDNSLQEYSQMNAKTMAQQQVGDLPQTATLPTEAVDHFSGRREELNKARLELNKYKGRFNEIKSVKELPKNPFKRHPLMGVKWYKRVQPGLQWQIGVGDVFRIDLGPRLSYLVTDKLELGASYQERLSIDKALPAYASFSYNRVTGYTLFGSYQIKKGFYGQLGYERLNTLMQQLPHQQEAPHTRVWVQGLRLGLGKRYTLYKSLQGYSLLEYNFTRSLHAPYRQQLQVKVGIILDRR